MTVWVFSDTYSNMSLSNQQDRDSELPKKLLCGDDFDQIVRHNQTWLRAYFRSRLQDKASADDLAQEVFVTAYLKHQSFKGESSIESWLGGIAHNHLRNFIRKKRDKAVGGSAEIQAIWEESCDHWEKHRPVDRSLDALAECIRLLPESSSDLLKQRYNMGLSVREIATKTGKGYSGLSMQFFRLRELLAKCIQQELVRGES